MGAAGVAAGAALSGGVVTPLNSETTTSAIRMIGTEIFQNDLDIAATYFLQRELRIPLKTCCRSLKFPYIVGNCTFFFICSKSRGRDVNQPHTPIPAAVFVCTGGCFFDETDAIPYHEDTQLSRIT
jgi:hypothetical protein